MKITELKSIIEKIEAKKDIIAKQRNGLRELHGEIGGLLESFDTGIYSLNEGVANIMSAIDSISEVV